MPPWPIAGVTLASAVVFGGCGPSRVPAPPLAVEFTETGHVALPEGFLVAGGTAIDSATLILWSVNQRRLLRVDRAGVSEVPLPEASGRVIAAGSAGSGVEVLDTVGTVTVVRLPSSGITGTRRLPLHAGEVLLSATRTGPGWVAVSRDSAGRAQLIDFSGPESGGIRHSLRGSAADSVPAPGVSAGVTDGVIVGFGVPPFEVIEIASAGLRAWPPKSPSLLQLGNVGSLREWRALPVAALDRGFLQVIADTKSDRRAVLRFDAAGVVVSCRLLDAPWGVIATSPGQERLWAVRQAGSHELVEYRWHWLNKFLKSSSPNRLKEACVT